MHPSSVSGLPFFFFNDTATTEIYTLSLHDALPIFTEVLPMSAKASVFIATSLDGFIADRKSTRLNSSHGYISYAVFCLKKIQQTTDVIAIIPRLIGDHTRNGHTRLH